MEVLWCGDGFAKENERAKETQEEKKMDGAEG
jgi:hypothetical protein